MIKRPLHVLRFVALLLFALPAYLLGQAAIEYGLKSAGSALPPGGAAAIAGCRVDSDLLACLSHSYPQTAIIIAAVICLLIGRWLYGQMGYRSH